MAEVQPFRGIRYRLDSPDQAGDLICPPYDVIAAPMQRELEERSPHNMVHLELPRPAANDPEGDSRYARAAEIFRQWQAEGVLIQEDQPALYLYGQRYRLGEGEAERLGLVGALLAEPYESGSVRPHEQTFPKHKEDRYRLLTTCEAQFSPIFGLYSAPASDVRARLEAAAAGEPVAAAVDMEGVEHRLWNVIDPGFHAWFNGLMQGEQVYIADGHHRFETALRRREEARRGRSDENRIDEDYVMTFLVEMSDPGLVLLPTHRLLTDISDQPITPELFETYFEVSTTRESDDHPLTHHEMEVLRHGKPSLRLRLRNPRVLQTIDQEHSESWRDLDVAILHRLVFQEILGLAEDAGIVYTRDEEEARELIREGHYAAGFLLPAPCVEELKAVAAAGDLMPHKSTYFWPKAISGLVIYGGQAGPAGD